jgi:hypothetical protein
VGELGSSHHFSPLFSFPRGATVKPIECVSVHHCLWIRLVQTAHVRHVRLPTYDTYVYPWWANLLGWGMALSSILCMPTLAITGFLFTSGSLKEVSHQYRRVRLFIVHNAYRVKLMHFVLVVVRESVCVSVCPSVTDMSLSPRGIKIACLTSSCADK